MRAVARILLCVLLAALLTLPLSAEETYTTDDFDLSEVLDSLPEDVRARLPDGDVFESERFVERFSFEYFVNLIAEAVATALSPALKTLCKTLGLVIIASALSSLRAAVNSKSLGVPFEFISGLCIMLTLYTTASSLVGTVEVYLSQLSSIVNAMVPVTIAVGTAGGNVSASAVSGSAMLLGLSAVETLAKEGLYPILQLCFGLSVASGLGAVPGLGGISKTVRGAFTWVLGLTTALISAVMTFQTSIASRADSLSMRALRFAASKSVPVVGSLASDAVSAVAESLALVRGTVGWGGVIIIAVLTLPVVINVLLTRMGVVVSAVAADVLGLEREKRILEEIAGLFGSLAAICVIAALMFVYALAVFAKSAVAMSA